ncbi:MAG: LLM class flavin-dependent oxidoreductase [Sphingomonadales bacterium]|nr:LLM class flavin-dependent oxidoreductase [Sphingomonadales bacterium]
MSVRIGIGSGLGSPLSPQDYWAWIDYCEAAGVDSIWHSDQLLGATLEPLAMLAALAARTSRMRFGTNALVIPFREPLVVAKQLATIDFLSGGRVFPVVGVGNACDPYWTATGADARERGRRSNEAIVLIRLLLDQDEVDFAGTHFRYRGPGVTPRPARPIPLWTGGHSEAAIRRTAELGDGWLGGLLDSGRAAETRLRIEVALAETGRRIEPDHYGVSLPLRIGAPDDPAVLAARQRLSARLPEGERSAMAGAFAVGSADAVIAVLRRQVAAGMSKFVVLPIANDAADLMAQTRLLVQHVLPAIEDRTPTAGEAVIAP